MSGGSEESEDGEESGGGAEHAAVLCCVKGKTGVDRGWFFVRMWSER